MREKTPYANMQTIKKDGRIEAFKINTVVYLPEGSNPTPSGEGQIADSIQYRPLTINYDATDKAFTYFDVNFIVKREDIGLLERGVKVNVKSNEVPVTRAMSQEETTQSDEPEEGVTLDYEDPDMP